MEWVFSYFGGGNLKYDCSLQIRVLVFWLLTCQLRGKKFQKPPKPETTTQVQKRNQPTTKLNLFFWKVRMESELLKNRMKDVKLTSYEYPRKLWKGIRAIKVLHIPCFRCGCYPQLRINFLRVQIMLLKLFLT